MNGGKIGANDIAMKTKGREMLGMAWYDGTRIPGSKDVRAILGVKNAPYIFLRMSMPSSIRILHVPAQNCSTSLFASFFVAKRV